jgi:hypothetical protein
MANEINIVLAESGASVTCQPYQAGAAVGSPISLTEIGTSAVYSGNMSGSAGTYLLAFHDGTENVGVGTIVWNGTAEVPVSTLTTGDIPSVPTAADNATAVRTELVTELSNLDAAVSTRATPADIPASDITAIKGKTDLLNSDRLANVATTNIVGTLLAQAHS